MKHTLIRIILVTGAALGNLNAQQAWEDARRPLTDLLELRDEKETLPKRRLIGRDQKSVQRDMDRVKSRLLEVLEESELTRLRDEYHALNAEQDQIRANIRDLREARINAPEARSIGTLLQSTQDQYTEKIAAQEQALKEREARKEASVEGMVDAYAEMGLAINEEQVRFYLTSVSGNDLMAMSALFHHTRNINEQLETLILADPADLPTARRYYGVHVVLLETLMHAHGHMIDRIDNGYLPDLSDLEEENQTLIRATRDLMKRAKPDQQEQLRRNQHLQELTAETLVVYRRHLDQVRGQIQNSLDALALRHEIADNSYATLRVSSALAAQIEQLLNDLGTLQSMHLPPLLPFQNEILEQKFREITRELVR